MHVVQLFLNTHMGLLCLCVCFGSCGSLEVREMAFDGQTSIFSHTVNVPINKAFNHQPLHKTGSVVNGKIVIILSSLVLVISHYKCSIVRTGQDSTAEQHSVIGKLRLK